MKHEACLRKVTIITLENNIPILIKTYLEFRLKRLFFKHELLHIPYYKQIRK